MSRPPDLSTVTVGGVPFRLCLFFTRNPEEELCTLDVAAKCGADPRNMHRILGPAVKSGWLARSLPVRGRGRQTTYSIGPTLRTLIGVE